MSSKIQEILDIYGEKRGNGKEIRKVCKALIDTFSQAEYNVDENVDMN